MPELPEVEAVCRKLRTDAVGSVILRLRMLRRRDPAVERRARGRRIMAAGRRGKNILLRLDNGRVLRFHLRMTGNLYVIPDARFLPATARAWCELDGGRGLIFDDPRALGRMEMLDVAGVAALGRELGPEPLDGSFAAAAFVAAARRSRQPSKPFLMDQRNVAGLGNIYAAEALFRAGIHPKRAMCRVSAPRLEALHRQIVLVLTDAVESASKAYSGPGSYHSEENFPVAVYGRAGLPCPVCGTIVRRIRQGGRSTYYCPQCQR